MVKQKEDLQLFIKQGRSYIKLLRKANQNGQYNDRIASIEKKLALARKSKTINQ